MHYDYDYDNDKNKIQIGPIVFLSGDFLHAAKIHFVQL
jgi:hypothetical protein